ncbi:MAG TPA: DUF4252 domain-containing protein [Thermoanaerobaculia bacterium]|nr:DUF4252 domain-containing protein [Thermoanaerobaculia bacterium]
MKTLRWFLVAAVLVVMAPAMGLAQKIALDIDTKELAAKAIETVEVTLDGQMLKAASRFLASEDGEKDVSNIVRRLEGIYVRSYTFAEEGAYDKALVQQFRTRIGPGWQKIVNVQKAGEENVEIYTHLQGEVISGLVIIAAEPKELTFVNVVGPLDMAELSKIEGQLGIPRISEKKEK